jgi:hypothetical protein
MRRTAAAVVLAILGIASLVTARAAADGYSTPEIISVVKRLAVTLEMPAEKTDDVVRILNSVSSSDSFTQMVAGRPISAVLVYRSTEAGLFYKRRSGHGTIVFKDSSRDVPVRLSGSSFGASVGGAAEWGVGLVLKLKADRDFGGTYEGTERGATAADTSTPVAALFTNKPYVESAKAHDLVLIVSARGLSAGVSKGKLTITPEW